jgi:ABC-type methionine transport system ATPase subunit
VAEGLIKEETMAKRESKTKVEKASGTQRTRLWLTYPQKLIKEPVIWQLGHKFDVVTNVRQVSVTEQIGIVSLELEGAREQIKAAIKWLEKLGIKVEPVEINVIES